MSSKAQGRDAMRTRVLVVDDHPGILTLITALLRPEFDVVGSATDGETMISAAEVLHPDVIVTDIEMPRLNGIEAAKAVLRSNPALKVVILATERSDLLVRLAMEAGARGYVPKLCAGEELIPAIHSACGGVSYISPSCHSGR